MLCFRCLLMVEDDGVINGVKGGREVEDEDGYRTRIGSFIYLLDTFGRAV